MPDLDLIRKRLPAHYAECAKLSSLNVGFDADCTCTATADVEALLAIIAQQDRQLDQAARTVLSIVDPDGDYHRPSGEEHQ